MRLSVMTSMAALVLMMCVTSAMAASYDHEITSKDMTCAWKIDGDMLHVKMSAETEGWVAVGFNPSDRMKDANIIIGYVKGGKTTLVDHFGDKSVGHSEDTKLGGAEHVSLVNGTEENGRTTIEFIMPLNSGDKYDREISKDGDTVVLMAYGPDRDSFRIRHKHKDSKTVNLVTGVGK